MVNKMLQLAAKTGLTGFIGLSLLVLLTGCSHNVVPSGNTAPQINIDAFPSGGRIEKQDAKAGGIINVDIGSNLVFTGSATNPGGVRIFSIDISQNSTNLFSVINSSAPDPSSGKVPDLLPILGSNGAGGIGTTALQVNNLISPVQVKTSASNFGTASYGFSVVYAPVDPKQRSKTFTKRVILSRDLVSNLYKVDFPVTAFSGTIIALSNPGPLELILLKQGQSATNCSVSNPAAWFILGAGNQTFPADIQALFGSAAALPVTIFACTNPSAGSSPEQVQVDVTYRVN